jgi:hypothetical protein
VLSCRPRAQEVERRFGSDVRALAAGGCQGWTRAYDGLAYCVLADQLNRRGATPPLWLRAVAPTWFYLCMEAPQQFRQRLTGKRCLQEHPQGRAGVIRLGRQGAEPRTANAGEHPRLALHCPMQAVDLRASGLQRGLV